MTLAVRPRPFVVATVLYAPAEADHVRSLLEAIAPDQSLAFLLIEDDDDDPGAQAALRTRIQGASRLRCEVATADGLIEPNAMYFVPRGHAHALLDGVLHLNAHADIPASGVPDFGPFFTSLAGDQGRRGCVIAFAGGKASNRIDDRQLSLVAEADGLVLVQDAAQGAFRRIMRTSEQTEPVVTEVPLHDLSNVLLEHAEPLIAEVRPRSTSTLYSEVEAALPALCEILLDATGHDFRQYKNSTIIRRTLRRLHLIRCDSASAYVAHLRTHATEANRLFNDLLISVTAFFRDDEAFAALAAQVIPKLFEQRTPDQTVRVWVAGCATGEEAYSIAVQLREHLDSHPSARTVQIFATDLDERALAIARDGHYPASRLAGVSAARLNRFFTRTGNGFRVTKQLREMVLFSRHNLTIDAPFSNVDLLSCRNLLIYLGEELQHRVIPMFHYALRANGYLFLGPSESLSTHPDQFRAIDVKHRISQRIGTGKRIAPVSAMRGGPAYQTRRPGGESAPETDTVRAMQRVLADEFTPVGVTVTEEGHIVAVSGNVEGYLTVSSGQFINSITRLVRDGLRVAVRAALREAIALQQRIVHHSASLRVTEGVQWITVTAQPLVSAEETTGLYLLVFQPAGRAIAPGASPTPQLAEASNALIERLEFDLASTRDELQRTVQDLEAVNEELKSSNEELISINEEMQSSNEELESSKDELQASNALLEDAINDLANLLTSTRIPAVFLDDAGLVRRVTPTAFTIFNLRLDDVGRPLIHFTHNAVVMPDLPPLSAVHAADRPIEDEIEMRDGTWLQRRVLPYVAPDGTNDGIVVTFHDTTERRRHETAQRASEARFRQLAETIPQLAWMAEPDGSIFWYNQRWYDYTGMTATDVAGWGWERVHDPEILPTVMERWRASIESVTPFDMVFPLRGADGVYRQFLTRINPLRDEHGALVLWFGTNTDVSEERAQSEALRRRQRELQTLADNSPDALTRFDRQLRHVFVNAAVERATGIPASAFLGKTNREIGMPPALCELWERTLEQVFDSGQEARIEFEMSVDGKARYFLGRIVPELGPDAAVEYVLGVTRDCTPERVAEQALRDADRRKDEFLATLAHELRNPLAPIRNGLEILRLSADGGSPTAGVREIMERQIITMSRLIDDLLDISRISLGKVELKRELVAVRSIIDGALETIRPLLHGAQHDVVVEYADESMMLSADATRIAQVIANLLNNASKYTPDGGRIVVSSTRDGNEAVIRISDSGVGIPAAMLERVFEMFTQIEHTSTKAQGGLGIGLALVRQLVEMHGGTVRAESDGPGKGSAFTLRLPLDTIKPSVPPSDQHVDGAGNTSLRVLVVDDNVDAAKSMEAVFGLMGHDARSTFTGADALRVISEFQPDVVFLDIGLPDVSGYELAVSIRRDLGYDKVVLVALTGWGSEEHRRRSVEAGFDFHLTKPADAAIIRRILSRAQAR